ncbi:hypothetical protein ACT3XG_10355 [Paenibacillus polymyxa]|jgi:hypothetical protein|uniref:hypothetical protein n=1 Tax=Paenibacillus TaxID=44249 RepID=UPI0002DE6A52|nr:MULTISPECIES: hypothetical protein [Paenibacillus]AIY11291.1 hypothetical protein LK13_23220 [Paenibacillus polymyxa]KAF6616749.1 hypothetical protein HFE00_14180 [Paenibacillus sp. EKM101P]KAF6621700.1 hypothetical protein HFE03_14800 [Paenibacillus sp. EKM102P]KAF6630290.1 hypothetical protein HFE01_14840 [Paenibacillus sp. EKM10P]KAF6645541.1 hypothetical protein HFE02_16525 [Paenibacillus sp. EKM11P]
MGILVGIILTTCILIGSYFIISAIVYSQKIQILVENMQVKHVDHFNQKDKKDKQKTGGHKYD